MSGPTKRSRLRRLPERGTRDRDVIQAVLDAAPVAHVAVIDGGEPVVVPMVCARDGEELLLHGSPGSRMMRLLAAGERACVSATLVDGLVLARSAFHHSLNFRSVVAHGRARLLEGDEATAALTRLVDAFLPGRGPHCRPPTAEEVRHTRIVAFPLDDAMAKVRTGPPIDDEEDLALPHWAGVVPLRVVAGEPEPAPGIDGPPEDALLAWVAARRTVSDTRR